MHNTPGQLFVNCKIDPFCILDKIQINLFPHYLCVWNVIFKNLCGHKCFLWSKKIQITGRLCLKIGIETHTKSAKMSGRVLLISKNLDLFFHRVPEMSMWHEHLLRQ